MKTHYGILFPQFWGGKTGREIAKIGGVHAQVVGLYLTSNEHANMIGLYPVSVPVIRSGIRTLDESQIVSALAALDQAGFARYDLVTEVVWVIEMARVRLGLDRGKVMSVEDKRLGTVAALYERVIPNPFLSPFFAKYRQILHLPRRRRYEGALEAPSMPLMSHSGGPASPETASVTGSGSTTAAVRHQEDQEQRFARFPQVVEKSVPEPTSIADIRSHLKAACYALLASGEPDFADGSQHQHSSLCDALKYVAARDLRCFDYTATDIHNIVDGVLGLRARRLA